MVLSKNEDIAYNGEMARSKTGAEQLIARYAARLQAALADRRAFDAILLVIQTDASLSAADVAEIAARVTGRKRPTSKASALKALALFVVERLRADGNGLEAARARPL